jgi:ubiquinone/menaquinone biosynthesis C-methylase UbiE
MGTSDDSSTRSWEAVADDWVAHADTNDYRNIVLMPLTLELIGDVAGQRVLDLGCGEGGYSRELAKLGATVVGVDGSERLVSVARERSADSEPHVRYICANASRIEGIEAEYFDQVLAAMSLMDVEDYDGAIDEAWRVLVPGGTLLMSITHPSFSAPTAEWVKTDRGELGHFAVDRYFDRVVWEDFVTPRFRRPILRRHRPLEDFVRPLLHRGFVLRNLAEPTATPAQVQQSARLARLARIPYFLFMQWQKPNVTT